MKRRIGFIMCFILIFSFTACHHSQNTPATPTDESTTQVVNPVRTVNGADDFPNDLRFYMIPPENAEDCHYGIIFAEIAQIQFLYEDSPYNLRGTYKEGDNSGVYGPFEEAESAILLDHLGGGCDIRIRYTTDGSAVANWSLRSMQFSLAAAQVTDREEFSYVVTQIASSQLDRCYEEELNSQQQILDSASSGHIEILSGGITYYPYTTCVYSMFWDGQNMLCADGGVDLKSLKQADAIPSLPYYDDFAVTFTNGGELDIIVLYDEDFHQLEDQWDLNCFTELNPGTYYAEIVITEYGDYIPEADETTYAGYSCVFELIVE